MELGLSLGDTQKPFSFLDKSRVMVNKDLGFCMGLEPMIGDRSQERGDKDDERRGSSDPPFQLDLLPFSPVPRRQLPSQPTFPWLTENLITEAGSGKGTGKGVDVRRQVQHMESEEGAAVSSPTSAVSSFQMDLSMYRSKRDFEVETERGSDDEDNCLARKKLRLTKDQSAFLEDSFKEHNTLNPKQKLALAKQLNLRPRQVEVWFQNRRARTKLKQTEVDCEYLKRCCETLTDENRRLQKELQELRALKTSQPFYMQLPATTLTMCPSCERVASTTPTTTATATATNSSTTAAAATTAANTTMSLGTPRLHPFLHAQVQARQASS